MPPLRKAAESSGRFDLTITAAAGARFTPFLRRYLHAAHALLRPQLHELSLALVGDRRMAQLHEQFLHVAGPTDVLTFPLETDRRGRVTAGEVVVCVPEARRRAHAEGVAVERELLLYALHGMLHLLGFDDRTDPGFAAMHRAEDDILTRLGVGPVFATAGLRVNEKPAPRRAIGDSRGAGRDPRPPTMTGSSGGRSARPARSRPKVGGAGRPRRRESLEFL